ncbi:MAG TPA: sulfide/dihydroorotate dehydrogenase-like FAD/NAD-binding protein [Clostridia bacterium]|nr:sulfide/dihydroorotate dehydrogenase-like FAD/NAD-binding protein [Clostridia bacterium]
MNKLLHKKQMAQNVTEYTFNAPDVVRNAKAGQFIVLRVDQKGERVPFTIFDYDKEKGTLKILVQTVGFSTQKLSRLNEGDYVSDIVGPLGLPTDLSFAKKVVLIGGGIGAAVIHPQSKVLKKANIDVDVILGARDSSLIMYEEDFKKYANNVYVMTDNGSLGEKGNVVDKLRYLIETGSNYDVVFAVGPLMMMKAVSNFTKTYSLKTIISMNSIMIDGIGMCGGCRLTVGGETKYACVDGPEFDAHLIDFDEAIMRSRLYQEEEKACRLRGEKND